MEITNSLLSEIATLLSDEFEIKYDEVVYLFVKDNKELSSFQLIQKGICIGYIHSYFFSLPYIDDNITEFNKLFNKYF